MILAKTSLGHKQIEDNPWDEYAKQFTEGNDYEGTVKEVFDKGAVIALSEEVEAFVPKRHTDKEDGSSDEDELCDEDCGCDEYEVDDSDFDNLAIRNYVENKHEDGEFPSLKQIQSRMKGSNLTCANILYIVEELGFYVETDEDVPQSKWQVYPN